MKKGMLITFEGLDAACKDTQTKLAAAYLEKRNLPYRLLSSTSSGSEAVRLSISAGSR